MYMYIRLLDYRLSQIYTKKFHYTVTKGTLNKKLTKSSLPLDMIP